MSVDGLTDVKILTAQVFNAALAPRQPVRILLGRIEAFDRSPEPEEGGEDLDLGGEEEDLEL